MLLKSTRQLANKRYSAILKAPPNHPHANQNIGLLIAEKRGFQRALPFFKMALKTKPSVAQFWLSYIDALIKLGRFIDAQAVFGQAKTKGAKGEAFNQLEKRLFKSGTRAQTPSLEQLQPIINWYTEDLLPHVLTDTHLMLKQFPNAIELHNLAGQLTWA